MPSRITGTTGCAIVRIRRSRNHFYVYWAEVILCAKPAPALRQFIRYYYQFEANLGGTTVLQPVPARSPQVLEFTFGTPYEFHSLTHGQLEPTHRIAVVGAHTCRAGDLAIRGQVEAFTLVFQPAGLHLLSPVPAESLTGCHFEGEAILGRGIAELRRRLEDADSFRDRVQAANVYLCRQGPSLDSLSCIARAATEVVLRWMRSSFRACQPDRYWHPPV